MSSAADSTVSRRRAPAIVAVSAFVLGILGDRVLGLPAWELLIATSILLVLAIGLRWLRCPRLSVVCLLATLVGAGAVRHHSVWFIAESTDISLAATTTSQPVRLFGSITTRPLLATEADWIAPSIDRVRERTTFEFECSELLDGTMWSAASGCVQVTVNGLMRDLRLGDEVELLGRLSRPDVPHNIGEFHFADYLRRKGIRALLRCQTPQAVLLRQRPDDLWLRWRLVLANARNRCERLLREQLRPDVLPVAVALLLGSRLRMSSEHTEAFLESGTMHVLAISGLNVAILAVFVGWVCRAIHLPHWLSCVLTLSLVGGYAAITDAGPPVVRASLLVFLAALGWPRARPVDSANLLAVTALAVVAWSPTDAFDGGAQLSFLAVAIIVWYARRTGRSWMARLLVNTADTPSTGQPETIPDPSPRLPQSGSRRLRSQCWRTIRDTTALSTLIWLFTAPIVATRFHLVSPIGVLVNIPLLPVASVTLCCGYSLLLAGFASETVASWIAPLFEQSLRLMLWIVEVAAGVACGHRYVPTPPAWWLWGAAIFLSSLFWWRTRPLQRHCGWTAVVLWIVFGLTWSLLPRGSGPFRCTTLSVGHGLSVLVEAPSGRTLLYDAGMMGNARRAKEIVQQALWHRGRSRLDGLVLSHADADHINGVPGLLRSIPVGRIFVSPQFLDWQQPAVAEVLKTARQCSIPVQMIWQGDSLPIDDQTRCRVLHPSATFKSWPDNANSLVLAVEYARCRILLTGDLERDGLFQLLQTPPLPTDVLLSPHHGSLGANTSDLARWARPNWLVVSGDRRANLATLRSRFGPGTAVLSTYNLGAITFEIDSSGEFTCQTVLPITQPNR